MLRIGTPAQHQPFRFARAFLTQKSDFFEPILNSLPQDKGALESFAVSEVDPNLFGVEQVYRWTIPGVEGEETCYISCSGAASTSCILKIDTE
jgi:hypothetical protein